MQVQTQAAQHADQLKGILAACHSIDSRYKAVEDLARKTEERTNGLADQTGRAVDWLMEELENSKGNTGRAFDWLRQELDNSKGNTSKSNGAEATMQQLAETLEYKKNAEKSNEELQRVRKEALEAKELAAAANQREELQQVRKEALEAKQLAAAATHGEEFQQVRKDALEAKQLAVAAAQRQKPPFALPHSSRSRPLATSIPARRTRFLQDQNSAGAKADSDDEISSDDEIVLMTKDKGKGKLADRSSEKVRSFSPYATNLNTKRIQKTRTSNAFASSSKSRGMDIDVDMFSGSDEDSRKVDSSIPV